MKKSRVSFYEGSCQFKQVETDRIVSESYIEQNFVNQYEYRPTTETIWAIVEEEVNGKYIEVARYKYVHVETTSHFHNFGTSIEKINLAPQI